MVSAPMTLGAVLLLLIPWAFVQAAQCAPDGSPQLYFVAQLNVSGCALFVHDTRAKDGLHLAVEPIMCVTEDLQKVASRYDSVTQRILVSVPVMLRDEAMLAEVQRQLLHLSPKSVKFAAVTDISVSSDPSSKFQDLLFFWRPEEPIGILEMECKPSVRTNDTCILSSRFNKAQFEALYQMRFTVNITSNNTTSQLNYRLQLQNETFFDTEIAGRVDHVPKCQLRFVRSFRLRNCVARVHQRLDMEGAFLIEPLLCHKITDEPDMYEYRRVVMYDYSRDMYYLKLQVVLQDDMAMDAVIARLAMVNISPRSVKFMRLWRAQSHVTWALNRHFLIGPLMASVDGKSAQLRVYCKTESLCNSLRTDISNEPINFWRHIRYSLTSMTPDCGFIKSDFSMNPNPVSLNPDDLASLLETEPEPSAAPKSEGPLVLKRGHRNFVVIQRRLTGSVSFQQTWAEYVSGFGDQSDFWIGLSEIHSLSMNGTTLRVEMELWSRTEVHVEYSGFTVGNASTNYRMTYKEMLRSSSSIFYDSMQRQKGMQFSTMDRDNDGSLDSSCSRIQGNGGWWFNNCYDANPNGLYSSWDSLNVSYCAWNIGSRVATIRKVRLMLQI